mgnify:CR=1 FL=1
MESEREILSVVRAYQESIHSQDREAFCALWARKSECSLISITNAFIGVESIYQDFLIDGIRKAYSSIDLIAEDIAVRVVNDGLALVIFQYHTQCLRRETGEPHGIAGVETQVLVREEGRWKLLHVHYSK